LVVERIRGSRLESSEGRVLEVLRGESVDFFANSRRAGRYGPSDPERTCGGDSQFSEEDSFKVKVKEEYLKTFED
jgi:hypothetical protein